MAPSTAKTDERDDLENGRGAGREGYAGLWPEERLMMMLDRKVSISEIILAVQIVGRLG